MLPDNLVAPVMEHAMGALPLEACGVLTVEAGETRYRPCRNVALSKDNFAIAPEDWAAAEDAGRIAAVVHSHPYGSDAASMADRVGCEKSGLPWIVVSVPNRTWACIQPSGYRAPLEGRPFRWGTLDCYALVRDYYAAVLSIDLPDFPRSEGWDIRGENLLIRNFEAAGFSGVVYPAERIEAKLQPHDVLLMQIGSPDPNHCAVYLGDTRILHHAVGQLSKPDVYGGYWRSATVKLLRHRSFTARGI